MKIKNKRELVLRARGHARADHIEQGTYGEGKANGHVEFKGCAIGCLATPHRKNELRSWIERVFSNGWYNDKSDDMIQRLSQEFGITEELARAAEDVFEGLQTHGAAINFIPEFAEALPEGVDIRPRDAGRIRNQLADVILADADDREYADTLLNWLRGLAK